MNNELKPNKHGIYPKALANHVFHYIKAQIEMNIRLLEIGFGKWIEAIYFKTLENPAIWTYLVEVPSKTYRLPEQALEAAKKDLQDVIWKQVKEYHLNETHKKEILEAVDWVKKLSLTANTDKLLEKIRNESLVKKGQMDLFSLIEGGI